MNTDTSLTILVIVLSVTLAVALLLTVVLLMNLIQISNSIKRVTAKAEEIADKAEAVSEFFERSAGPVAIGRLLSNIFDVVNRKNKRG